MHVSKLTERLVLAGSGLSFALAMALHTFVVVSEIATEGRGADPLTSSLLAGAVSLLVALPLGALLRLLPRRFGTRGVVVAGLAVIVAVGLVFASEQVLLDVLGNEDGPGFVTTRWLWDHTGLGGSLLYLLSVPFDLIVIVFFILARGVAIFVVPPAAAICCGSTTVLVAMPFLMRFARKNTRS